MPEINEHETILRRIGALARQVADQDDVPQSSKAILAEIIELSVAGGGDTPEPSDMPRTENQTL